MPDFWDFKNYEKWDVLNEHRHAHLITGAMEDPSTGCSKVDLHSYILYGPEEGLLLSPQASYLKIAMELYHAICIIIGKN